MVHISEERIARMRAAAEAARRLHYAPYSAEPGPVVLAAAELASGTVAGGSNIEISNLSLTKHAEEVAILLALANDTDPPGRGRLSAVYVAGLTPCGSCRQFAFEFAEDEAVWILEPIAQAELRATSLQTLASDRQPHVVPFGDYLPAPLRGFDRSTA